MDAVIYLVLFVISVVMLLAQARLFSIDRSLKRLVEILELQTGPGKSEKPAFGQSFTFPPR